MHDHRVSRRNIETGFHNGRGQKHIILAVIESVHDVIEYARRHLTVGHGHFQFGHVRFQELLYLAKIGNARADVETLAATIAFAQKRLANDERIER